MSFGFSVGDFIAVGNLAWTVYRSCKGATDDFKDVTKEALTVHILFEELQDEARNEKSILNLRDAHRKQEFLVLVDNMKDVLKRLEAMIKKYEGHTRRERRIYNQFKLANEDLGRYRDELTFYATAINAFLESLSRGTIAQIERTLLELVKEVREGRRPPSVVSIDEKIDNSVWGELEDELAADGISRTDIYENKLAVKIFLKNLLSSTNADAISLDEVVSIVESSNDKEDLESLSRRMSALDSSPRGPSRVSTMSSAGNLSFTTANSSQYQSAVEDLPGESISGSVPTVPRVSFAVPFNIVKNQPIDGSGNIEGIDSRLKHFTPSSVNSGSVYAYRHSVDASTIGSRGPRHMVLMVDRTHSCISKLAHAYLRSLTKSNSIVREHVDTVRSNGWRMHESGGTNTLAIDALMRDLMIRKKVEIPKWEQQSANFRFQDVLEFDHIVYLNSPSFPQYLEENLQTIANRQAAEGNRDKTLAILSRHDFPSSVQLPETMTRVRGFHEEMFHNRQKLALEEIYKAVQRFTLDFLERTYGLKKSGHSFEKIRDGRRSSSLSPFDQQSLSRSSGSGKSSVECSDA